MKATQEGDSLVSAGCGAAQGAEGKAAGPADRAVVTTNLKNKSILFLSGTRYVLLE